MKKSLILSIVMTLVLVISMSTATFAWYTSQGTVTASVNTITATTAGGSLQVKLNSGSYGSDVSETAAGTLDPSSPTETLTSTNVGTGIWAKGTQDFAGTAFDLSLTTTGSYITGTVTVQNSGQTPLANGFKISIAVDAASEDSEDVAADAAAEYVVFEGTSLVLASDYELTAAGPAKGDKNATGVAASYSRNSEALAAGAEITFTYYIWLNGWEAMNSASAGEFNVVFTFETL